MSPLFNMLSRFGRVQLEICWLGNISYFSAKVDTDFPGSGKSLSGPEKTMALHSSTLAWKIPWTEEPGTLQSMGSLRVRHD